MWYVKMAHVKCVDSLEGGMRDWRDGCGVSIGTGQTGGNLDRFFCVKNREKRRILDELGREKSKSRSD